MMDDEDSLEIFVMPCNHAYHMFYFSHIATSKDECIAMGYIQPISHTTLSLLVMLDNTDASFSQVEATFNP